jgi:hypothetical protein
MNNVSINAPVVRSVVCVLNGLALRTFRLENSMKSFLRQTPPLHIIGNCRDTNPPYPPNLLNFKDLAYGVFHVVGIIATLTLLLLGVQ